MKKLTCVECGALCDPLRRSYGRCLPCYGRLKRTPGFVPSYRKMSLTDRLALYEIDHQSGCWISGSGRSVYGYAVVKIDGVAQKLHRLAYVHVHGPIPDGLVIDHMCHNFDLSCPGGKSCRHRGCINPDHLEPVTHAENLGRARERERLIQRRAAVLATTT